MSKEFERRVRADVYDEDIGQYAWFQAKELDEVVKWLDTPRGGTLLDIGCGAPPMPLVEATGCSYVGLGNDPTGIERVARWAAKSGMSDRVRYIVHDANDDLPFDDETFDGLMCFDLVDHLEDRAARFRDWRCVLKSGARTVFTDPIVVTGPVTNEEIRIHSYGTKHIYSPPGYTEAMLAEAGLTLVHTEDLTLAMARYSKRQAEARRRHCDCSSGKTGNSRSTSRWRSSPVSVACPGSLTSPSASYRGIVGWLRSVAGR